MKTLYKHKRSGDIFDDFEGVEQINGGKEEKQDKGNRRGVCRKGKCADIRQVSKRNHGYD